MQDPPRLTDPDALARQRRRARPEALFLHDIALAQIEERLDEVNRTFTAPAVVTGFPQAWQGFREDSVIVPDAPVLDLKPGAHDLVVHAMGLHWADDPIGQLVQCRHALKPDGLFIGVCLGGATLSNLRASLAEAESRIAGGLSPRIAPMAEIRDLGALLQRAGFALPVADGDGFDVTYADPLALMRELRAMGEGNALAARRRHFTRRAVLLEAARLMQAHFATPEGRVATRFELIYLTGWAPHESQQQPMRPGSARTRLADALAVPEIRLPEDGPAAGADTAPAPQGRGSGNGDDGQGDLD